jgi:hypothetical protein
MRKKLYGRGRRFVAKLTICAATKGEVRVLATTSEVVAAPRAVSMMLLPTYLTEDL